MAAVTSAVVAAGATAYSANRQSAAAKAGARASQQATDASIAEQQRQFDLTRADQKPWLDAGTSALGRLSAASTGDMSSFFKDPGYQFTLDQGLQMKDRGAAARGGLFSGGHQADLMRYGQGLASQEFGNWWNRQAGLAGVGQSAANNLGQMGMTMAGNNANLRMGNADNLRQSSYARGQAQSNMAGNIAGIAGLLGNYYSNRPTGMANGYTAPSYGFASGFGNNTGWLSGGRG